MPSSLRFAKCYFLKASEDFERIWLLCYRDTGCLAICNIYSGHVFNENEFSTLANEIEGIRSEAETVLIAGDFNTHQRSWLKFSTSDTPKGNALRFFAETQGLRQLVDFPTRCPNALDLVLTHFPDN